MKKYIQFSFIIFLAFCFSSVNAEEVNKTGFIPGQIWYSKENPTEGDTIKIYTVIWNSNNSPLSTKVEFYDKNVILGSRDLVVQPEQVKEVYVNWKVTSGDHVISAQITSSTLSSNGKKENVVISNSSTSLDRKFIPAVVKNASGDTVTSSDMVKNEFTEATSKINNVIPEPVSSRLNQLESVRNDTYSLVVQGTNNAKKEIKLLSDLEISKDQNDKAPQSIDPVHKPITYIKLYLLTFIGFILGNKILFYGVILLIIFYILRSIYFKIRNR